jgi:hypothetical protein
MKTNASVLLASLLLTGCVELTTTPAPTPVSDPNAYAPVEFAKVASGAFVQELDGKLVSLKCRFTQSFSLDGRNVQMRVSAIDPGTPGMIGVSVVDSLREKAVVLKTGDVITLRGKVRTSTTTHMVSGASWTGSYIEGYFIDP